MGLTLLTLDCSTSTSARAAQCPPCRQPDPDELQRITESIWWYRDEGNHSAEALRLGKQTLCQLSYSRSGARGAQADLHSNEGEPADQRRVPIATR